MEGLLFRISTGQRVNGHLVILISGISILAQVPHLSIRTLRINTDVVLKISELLIVERFGCLLIVSTISFTRLDYNFTREK